MTEVGVALDRLVQIQSPATGRGLKPVDGDGPSAGEFTDRTARVAKDEKGKTLKDKEGKTIYEEEQRSRPICKQYTGHCQVNWLPRVQATPLSIQTWFY